MNKAVKKGRKIGRRSQNEHLKQWREGFCICVCAFGRMTAPLDVFKFSHYLNGVYKFSRLFFIFYFCASFSRSVVGF